jgi:hypothetical protein
MAMEQVRRDQAISKEQFHSRLRDWLDNTDDNVIGPEGVDGRTAWIHVHDGSTVFVLHADTKREAVTFYLRLVEQHGGALAWKIAPSQRGKMTTVVYGPEKVRHRPFYLYVGSSPA